MPKSFDLDQATPDQHDTLDWIREARAEWEAAERREDEARQQLSEAQAATRRTRDELMRAVRKGWNLDIEAVFLAKHAGIGRATLYRHMGVSPTSESV